jgi:purine nucleoside phosphorylase
MLITAFSGGNPLIGESSDRLGSPKPMMPAFKAIEGGEGDRHRALKGRLYVVFRPLFPKRRPKSAWRTSWANAVGMSTVPEVVSPFGLRVAACSVTNLAAGMTGTELASGNQDSAGRRARLATVLHRVFRDRTAGS